MRAVDYVIGAGWIGLWSYWIISAFYSKKGRHPSALNLVRPRLLAISVAIVLAVIYNHLPHSLKVHTFRGNRLVLALGLLLFLAGFSLAIWARVYLGKNWGLPMTEKNDPELVTTGPYKYVRHPIYSGLLLMALGSALDVNIYWWIVLAVSGTFFIYSAVVEEKLMSQQFPKVYPAYKAKTKMLIPFIL
jgi:protein-S-isoprenylcysteine O-methyltransferase Ste14